MKKQYEDEVKALQRAAGIRITEEVTVSSSGVEMEEEYDAYEDGTDPDTFKQSETPLEEREMYGYDQVLNAVNSIKAAEATLNALIGDQKFNGKFKQDFQVYVAELNKIHGALTNKASIKTKEKKSLKV